MLMFPACVRTFVANAPCDRRRGVDSLAAMVKNGFEPELIEPEWPTRSSCLDPIRGNKPDGSSTLRFFERRLIALSAPELLVGVFVGVEKDHQLGLVCSCFAFAIRAGKLKCKHFCPFRGVVDCQRLYYSIIFVICKLITSYLLTQ